MDIEERMYKFEAAGYGIPDGTHRVAEADSVVVLPSVPQP